jgi:predicted negative regulator of RcsB-dependent stress response
MASQNKTRRIALYATLILLVIGGTVGWWLWDSHRRNVETGNQFEKIAEQMEKANHPSDQ